MVMMTDFDSPLISEGPPMWKLREEMEREAEERKCLVSEVQDAHFRDYGEPLSSLLFL
jgi:hypothetical protein